MRNLNLLNPNAGSALELYNTNNDGNEYELDQGWKDIMLSPEICSQQQDLQSKIQRVDSLHSVQEVQVTSIPQNV